MKDDCVATKLRVVFDDTCKPSNGNSLNSILVDPHTTSQQVILNGFCDASELAYASVIYAVHPQAYANIKRKPYGLELAKIVSKNYANLALAPRFLKVHIESPLEKINRRFVYTMRTIGQGHAAMTTFCGVMDFIPPVAEKSYNNIINKLQLCSKEVTEASMQSAALEEDVILGNEERGSPAYKKWKILHVKECLKKPQWFSWHDGTVGMVRIFQRSLSHRSVSYTSYIGDGDSKTFSSISSIRMEVSKECLDMFKKNGNSFTTELQTQ
ncbi:hypothetical protein TNCV_3066311 [Trichonephila clavipes]|uniref:Mutator-like transposase domain-containing protein n=1 Tax=Trichonephila clavipes TaxID=2585209 RepID=A0A8X6RS23_TRICX|nr:hypothetical protein TNCV_3066311 [Trichonephila clavipes]